MFLCKKCEEVLVLQRGPGSADMLGESRVLRVTTMHFFPFALFSRSYSMYRGSFGPTDHRASAGNEF